MNALARTRVSKQSRFTGLCVHGLQSLLTGSDQDKLIASYGVPTIFEIRHLKTGTFWSVYYLSMR